MHDPWTSSSSASIPLQLVRDEATGAAPVRARPKGRRPALSLSAVRAAVAHLQAALRAGEMGIVARSRVTKAVREQGGEPRGRRGLSAGRAGVSATRGYTFRSGTPLKIFLSWSGPRSRAVAEALNDWLPRVIQAVRPFFSPEIEKGANWSNQIDKALEGTRFGVVCLTRDNLTSEWIHYETGALSKTGDALVWTFLLDVDKGDVKPPLGKFHHTAADEADVRELVRTINRRLADAGGTPLREAVLDETFDDLWPRLKRRLDAARELENRDAPAAPPARREIEDMIEEVLEILRQQQRAASSSGPSTPVESLNLRRYLGGNRSTSSMSFRRFRVVPVSQTFSERFEAFARAFGFDGSFVFRREVGQQSLSVTLDNQIDGDLLEQIIEEVATQVGEPVPIWRPVAIRVRSKAPLQRGDAEPTRPAPHSTDSADAEGGG